MYRVAWVALIFELIDMFMGEYPAGSNPLMQTTNISSYIGAISGVLLFSVQFAFFIKPLLFRKKRLPFVVFAILVIAGCLSFSLGLLYLFEDYVVLVPYWSILMSVAMYIAIYYILRAVSRYKDHGSIRKRKDPGEQSFWQSIDTAVSNDLSVELEKRYQKMINRQKRKGKEMMSGEEYLKKLRTDVNQFKIIYPFAMVFFMLFLLIMMIAPFFTTTEEFLFIPVISACALALFEIPVILLFRAVYRAYKRKEEIVEYCETHGITLAEYVAEQSEETLEED